MHYLKTEIKLQNFLRIFNGSLGFSLPDVGAGGYGEREGYIRILHNMSKWLNANTYDCKPEGRRFESPDGHCFLHTPHAYVSSLLPRRSPYPARAPCQCKDTILVNENRSENC